MIKVRVPATSANLGPGFDVMGLALNRYNTFTFIEGVEKFDDTLICQAYKSVFEYLGKDIVPVEIKVEVNIPIARGLGSSATCIVGGIIGANEILGGPLNKEEILKLATEIEGHPDNVAPAIYGGLVVSAVEGDQIYKGKIPIKNDLEFIALVPNYQLSTSTSRKVLPKEIPYANGIYNVGRASMFIAALVTGDNSLLKIGLQDKFHQPYRGKLISGFDNIISAAYESGALGCYLSGAGPAIMCIGEKEDSQFLKDIKAFMKDNYPDWEVYAQSTDNQGAIVL